MHTQTVDNPIWIFDVKGRSYKFIFLIEKENYNSDGYRICVDGIEFYTDGRFDVSFVNFVEKTRLGYETCKVDEVYNTEEDAINSYPADIREGIKAIQSLYEMTGSVSQDKKDDTSPYERVSRAIDNIKKDFRKHNEDFLKKFILTEQENTCLYEHILSLSDEDVIDLWNRQAFLEIGTDLPTYNTRTEIFRNSKEIYRSLCNFDNDREYDGKTYQKYNDYDLYIWREEPLGEYPRVYTFSSVDEIHLRDEIAMFIKHHPYMYIDIINEVREQIKK